MQISVSSFRENVFCSLLNTYPTPLSIRIVMQLRTALFKLIFLTTGIILKADAVARTHSRLSLKMCHMYIIRYITCNYPGSEAWV